MKKETIFSIVIICIMAISLVLGGIFFGGDRDYEYDGDDTEVESPETQGPTEEEFLSNYVVVEVDGFRILKGRNNTGIVYDYKGNKTSVTIPGVVQEGENNLTVTEIYASAFKDNTKVKTIVLPATLAKIGDSAFEGCTSLNEINIDNVKTLGKSMFKNCSSLKEVDFSEISDIPESILENAISLVYVDMSNTQTIAAKAFANCSNLETLVFKNITAIGDESFSGCKSLQSFESETTVKTIGKAAFKNCSYLRLIKVGSLQVVEEDTFNGCTMLNVVILDKVTVLNDRAFYNCKSLNFISFPELKSISSAVFSGCTSLISISAPEVEEIGGSAFYNCVNLSSVNSNDAGTVNFENVGKIKNYKAFYNCDSIKNLNIGTCVEVGYDSFMECDNLTTVTMPKPTGLVVDEGVENGEELALKNSLIASFPTVNNITFRNNFGVFYTGKSVAESQIIETKQYSFDSEICGYDLTEDQLKEILVAKKVVAKVEDVENIEDYYYCFDIVTFSFNPKNFEITNIEFSNLSGIEKVIIPEYINNRQVLSINIPDLENIIGTLYSFTITNIKKLSGFIDKLDFPNLVEIEDSGLEYCVSLEEINAPKLQKVGMRAFENCFKLQTINFPELVEIGDFAFEGCSSIKSAYLNKLTTLSFNAFANCFSLEEIQIPLLTKIKDYAFFNCVSLSKVNSKYEGECDLSLVTEIGERLFAEEAFIFVSNNIEIISDGNLSNKITNIKLRDIKKNKLSNFALYNCSKLDMIELPFEVVNSVALFIEDYELLNCFVYSNGSRVEVKGKYGSFTIDETTLPPVSDDEEETTAPTPEIVTVDGFVFDKTSKTIIQYVGNVKNLEIPMRINGTTVEKIGANAFRDNHTIESVTIKSILEIGENAFKNCVNLTTVEDRLNLANDDSSVLEKIGHYAFEGCLSLENYTEAFEEKMLELESKYRIFAR